jgi:uncharacterized membrane protein YeaQ/YmgE (transglycosylase-associated protein family)
MTLLEFLVLLVVAGICGSVAQALAGYSHGGCLVSIMLGLVGALLGTWLARVMGIGDILSVQIGDQPFPIVWSVIGAALFAGLLNLLSRRRAP